MKGNSINKTVLANVRIAGLKDKEGQLTCGGTYIPAHVTKDGKLVRARWFGQVCINENYLDNGKLVEKKSFMNLTVWNKKNTDSGEKAGMAEVFARMASKGRQIDFCEVRIRAYTKAVYDAKTGKHVTREDGSYITCDDFLGAELINSFECMFGDESAAQILREESAWNQSLAGKACFHARPVGMDDTARTAFMSLRKGVHHTPGSEYFGHARVGKIPAGAKLAYDVIEGSTPQAIPGSVPANSANLNNIDLTNPAILAALVALGVQLPASASTPSVASASPAVDEDINIDSVPY